MLVNSLPSPFSFLKQERKMLTCEVFLLHFPLTSQWLPQWEKKTFFSKIAKCALVFSTPSDNSVSLFRFIMLAHTMAEGKVENLVINLGGSIQFLEVQIGKSLMSLFPYQWFSSCYTHFRIGGFFYLLFNFIFQEQVFGPLCR